MPGIVRSCRVMLLLWSILAPARHVAAQAGTVAIGDVVLHYWPGQDRLAHALLPTPRSLVFAGLPADILRRGDGVDVFLAPDAARWDSLTNGGAPEWGAGIAMPYEGIIVVPAYSSERTDLQHVPQILRHELAHIALHRFLGGAQVPRWFSEGYAMWSAGQFEGDAGWKLRVAFVSKRAPPLDSITLDWPLLGADAELAYLLSASAVRYLHSLGPAATFDEFLQRWRDDGSFELALRETYALASPQFERQWRAYAKRQYGWLQIIAQTAFIWTLLTLAVIALIVIRRRRDRAKLALLRDTEPPDEPAFWQPISEEDDTAHTADDEPPSG